MTLEQRVEGLETEVVNLGKSLVMMSEMISRLHLAVEAHQKSIEAMGGLLMQAHARDEKASRN